MAQQEQCAPSDAWARVKSRLRAELGEDVFASWFRGVEVEQVDGEVVHLTVATRFLRNWLAREMEAGSRTTHASGADSVDGKKRPDEPRDGERESGT